MLIPMATFLAGALLSLLLPTILLIALVVWYMKFIRGVPEPAEAQEPPPTAAPATSREAGGPAGEGP